MGDRKEEVKGERIKKIVGMEVRKGKRTGEGRGKWDNLGFFCSINIGRANSTEFRQ